MSCASSGFVHSENRAYIHPHSHFCLSLSMVHAGVEAGMLSKSSLFSQGRQSRFEAKHYKSSGFI